MMTARPCAHACPKCERDDRELPRMRATVREVAGSFGIPIERILDGTDRERRATVARQVAVWMLSERFPRATYDRIARLTGYRERSGPSHALGYVERRMRVDPRLHAHIASLREQVAA